VKGKGGVLDGLRKIPKKPDRLVGVPAEIRTGPLLNIRQKSYRLSQTCYVRSRKSSPYLCVSPPSTRLIFSYIQSVIVTPITVAARNFFAKWNIVILGLDHTRGMDVSALVLCLSCPVYVAALRQG
jgi:hypothetical protein